MIKILIADDHQLIRAGFKKLIELEIDMSVAGEAENGDEVLEKLRSTDCDLAVIDMNMPGRSGTDLIMDVRREFSDLKVLVLSMHPEDQFASRALKAGASGYITKDSPPTELIKAIRKINSGGTYISEKFAEILAMDLNPQSRSLDHTRLSDREFQVLKMIGQGKNLNTIAEELNLSQSSVNTYRKRILEKINLNSTAELIRYAVKENLV